MENQVDEKVEKKRGLQEVAKEARILLSQLLEDLQAEDLNDINEIHIYDWIVQDLEEFEESGVFPESFDSIVEQNEMFRKSLYKKLRDLGLIISMEEKVAKIAGRFHELTPLFKKLEQSFNSSVMTEEKDGEDLHHKQIIGLENQLRDTRADLQVARYKIGWLIALAVGASIGLPLACDRISAYNYRKDKVALIKQEKKKCDQTTDLLIKEHKRVKGDLKTKLRALQDKLYK